jgi:hypothetical protein
VRLACALLVFLAACPAQGGDDYPIGPGGGVGGTGSNGLVDAPPSDGDGDAGGTILGRVCLLTDLRRVAQCSDTDAGGLTVTLGTETATTGAQGDFEIVTPSGTNLVWRVSGLNVVSSVMLFNPVARIPVIGDELYGQLLTGNSVLLQDGQGTLLAHLTHAGVAAVGATATLNPATANATFYDGNNPQVWDTDATSTFGVTWLPGADVGQATITSTLGASMISATYPIENQAITWAEIEIP